MVFSFILSFLKCPTKIAIFLQTAKGFPLFMDFYVLGRVGVGIAATPPSFTHPCNRLHKKCFFLQPFFFHPILFFGNFAACKLVENQRFAMRQN
jgi:hypothetical protein